MFAIVPFFAYLRKLLAFVGKLKYKDDKLRG